MKKFIRAAPCFLILLGVCINTAKAQKNYGIKSMVTDSAGTPLQGCTVKLFYSKNDSLVTTTGPTGIFVFPKAPAGTIVFTAALLNFETFISRYDVSDDSATSIPRRIVLHPQANLLNPVTVTASNAVTIKEDTVSYKANAFKVRDNAPLEDMIRKLPGVDVDAGGNIIAQGKKVTKVRVNGKDFFGGDVQSATRNLPADIVENIQMIDDYGDQANLTGVKTGDPDKIMNITIRPDRNHGFTGQLTAGYGSDAVPEKPGVVNDGRYAGLLSAFRFNDDEQVSVLGNINNANVNTFSFGSPNTADPLTTKKLAAEALSTGKMATGSGGNFTSQASQQNGITEAHSAGINFRDQWGKNLSVYGSYSFADNTTVTQTNTLQQNTSPLNPAITTDNSNETNRNINHRFTWNMEYKPDTVNYIKITPTFLYSSTQTNSDEDIILQRNGAINSAYTATLYGTQYTNNYGLTVLYNHRFKRRGRNLSLNANVNSNPGRQYQNPVFSYSAGNGGVPLNQQISTNSNGYGYGVTASYMEPLGGDTYLEVNYAFSTSITNNNKQALVQDSSSHSFMPDAALSTQYNYTFTTNRFGINYRYAQKKRNYTLGISADPATLSGNAVLLNTQTNRSSFNIAPVARFVFNLSRSNILSVSYNGLSSQPSFTQLQPAIDFSNALYPVQGNPDLKPRFTNNFSAQYNKFDFTSGNTFFSNILVSQAQNQVVTNTIIYPARYAPNPTLQNTYLTTFTNAGGFYSASAYVSYAKPWHSRRYTIILNGSATYTNNIGYLTNVDSATYKQATQKNIAKNIVYTPGVRFRVDIPDVIDAQLLTGYSVSKTSNSVKNNFTNASANVSTLNIGVSGKSYIHKDWTLSYEFTKALNYGYTIPITNPAILNAYAERRFLKGNKATVRFAAYDIFNQNTGYSTTTTASAITQTAINRLGRYYLLSFTLRLQKFGK